MILPLGCQWARNMSWRIRMRCPNPLGQFFVPTRLQASTNITHNCYYEAEDLFLSKNTKSFQIPSGRAYMKHARQHSRIFGNDALNRYDYPYFPIYNSTKSTYWNCVGSKLDECVFTISSQDFAGFPASHGDIHLATLILPGPYCSTVDMFEHYDRSGGTVFKVAPSSNRSASNDVAVERLDFRHDPLKSLGFDSAEHRPANFYEDDQPGPVELNTELAKRPHLRQSENIYLVAGSLDPRRSKNVRFEFRDPASYCVAKLVPRNVKFARHLWATNKLVLRWTDAHTRAN